MVRVWSAVLASTAIGLLSVPADAQFKRGGGAPAAPAAAPHFSAPAAMPHFSAPAAVPHFSAPQPHFSMPQAHFSAPHIAAPAIRSVPHFSAPPHIAIQRQETPHIAHTETLRDLRSVRTPPPPSTIASSAKLQALSRAELHTQQRLDRLEQHAQSGHLNGREQKQLSALHEQQARQQLLHEQTTQKLQEQQKLREQNAQKLQDEKLGSQNAQKLQEEKALREPQKLQEEQKLKEQNAQKLQEQQKLREQNAQKLQEEKKLREAEELRRKEAPHVNPKDAAQGRFAGNLQSRRAETPAEEAREEAREAWRHNHPAFFVAWVGPIFWPYVYSDLFYYTFWPYGYDDGYWPYIYDDFFETVFWPNGGPYADYSYAGPYGGDFGAVLPPPPARPGVRPGARTRAITQATQATQLARALCSDPGNGVTAWPFAQIERAVMPTADQQGLLEDLKKAAATAADDFKASCSTDFPMTPPGRLKAMLSRLQATRDAVEVVRSPLAAFYASLSDEQKARFNAVGPDLAQTEARAAGTRPAAPGDQANGCGGSKPGLIDLPIERIADAVRPRGEQEAAFDRLREATANAVAALQGACPDTVPATPIGRLDAMASRLDALIAAAKTVQPALESFYGSLTDEQKAQFNILGRRQTASGG
jgi:chemotaxis protein histidine kinase CheA